LLNQPRNCDRAVGDSRMLIHSVLQGMNQAYKNCQSCGMPLKRDENGSGTNADGTRSPMYCSHCYQNGQFVLPDISVTEMQARVREKIVEFGMPGFLAVIFTCRIPKLARWQKA
jgi:Putative zinc ribbon domain